MKTLTTALFAGLALIASAAFVPNQAKAADAGQTIGVVNTVELVAGAISIPAAYANMGAIFVTMIGGCEISYKMLGEKCGNPGPTGLGYNQLRGLAPRPDGTTHADY